MFNLSVVLGAGLVGGLLGQALRNRGFEPGARR
jgi:prephenate dehydrogenase